MNFGKCLVFRPVLKRFKYFGILFTLSLIVGTGGLCGQSILVPNLPDWTHKSFNPKHYPSSAFSTKVEKIGTLWFHQARYPDGQLFYEGFSKAKDSLIPEGVWVVFTDNGYLDFWGEFQNGAVQGRFLIENAEKTKWISCNGEYYSDSRSGKISIHNPETDDEPQKTYELKDSLLHGTWNEFTINGDTLAWGEFEQGKLKHWKFQKDYWGGTYRKEGFQRNDTLFFSVYWNDVLCLESSYFNHQRAGRWIVYGDEQGTVSALLTYDADCAKEDFLRGGPPPTFPNIPLHDYFYETPQISLFPILPYECLNGPYKGFSETGELVMEGVFEKNKKVPKLKLQANSDIPSIFYRINDPEEIEPKEEWDFATKKLEDIFPQIKLTLFNQFEDSLLRDQLKSHKPAANEIQIFVSKGIIFDTTLDVFLEIKIGELVLKALDSREIMLPDLVIAIKNELSEEMIYLPHNRYYEILRPLIPQKP